MIGRIQIRIPALQSNQASVLNLQPICFPKRTDNGADPCRSPEPCPCAQVPVRVLYLDRSMGAVMAGVSETEETAVNHHDFIPEELQKTQSQVEPRVSVLYRPGHYDIIYHHGH